VSASATLGAVWTPIEPLLEQSLFVIAGRDDALGPRQGVMPPGYDHCRLDRVRNHHTDAEVVGLAKPQPARLV
jgi:hypothetical protein